MIATLSIEHKEYSILSAVMLLLKLHCFLTVSFLRYQQSITIDCNFVFLLQP